MEHPKKNTIKKDLEIFSPDELIKINEALETNGSSEDRLLFAVLMTGMRATQCTRITFEDLSYNANHVLTVNGIPLLNKNACSSLEILQHKAKSNKDYLFPSANDSCTPMSPSKFNSTFKRWLKSASVSQDRRSPHAVRRSIAIANLRMTIKPTIE